MPSPFYSPTIHSNASQYTLATVRDHSNDEDDERASLLSHSSGASYGVPPPLDPLAPTPPPRRRVILNAAIKMTAIFVIGCLVLGGTLWVALPRLEEMDRDKLRIPKSFEQLKDLNDLLKKYRDIYPFRILICFVITYLFLQAFSLPGSMYMSILGGAVWGVPRALPLCCACVATGSSLCYLLSAALGPALLTMPLFKTRLESLSLQIAAQRANMISFLIVLRIAPLPPHWVVNMLCPHLGIALPTFWISTFLGIFGVTVIHTTIGSGLDDMTSAADFRLISWRNFLTLSAVVIGALIPVGIRYIFARQSVAVAEAAEPLPALRLDGEDTILAEGPPIAAGPKPKMPVPPPRFIPSDDEESDEESFDEDIILEAGPALVVKHNEPSTGSPASTSSSTPHA
ncbi:hypothetical protein K488DRAFT_89230 [Vararia minispora EC-137]|uniref:Uncharacterized protein n=1 Tax=Vararia minispora EC-137 TaxID=1314806 RepID=A0ACB8QBB0_9AGAM|nr:hypothetical protein K488DRAFT_89230 [Vararia minispora EC-137]